MFSLMFLFFFKEPLAFSGWDRQHVDEGEVPAGLSHDRNSGRAKHVPLCSMVQFSLDLEGMLMGQHVVGWMGYRFEKELV